MTRAETRTPSAAADREAPGGEGPGGEGPGRDLPNHVARLDHDRYDFRTLHEAAPFVVGAGRKFAVMLTVVTQHYPIDARAPFPVPGTLDRPAPDFGTFTQRQVGQTDGLWRLVEAAQRFGIPVSFVVERGAVARIRDIEAVLRGPAHCVVAGGEHAVRLHTDAMSPAEERAVIEDSLAALKSAYGRDIRGWRSPYCSQSSHTLELLAQCGVEYVCDFANDDRPYPLRSAHGSLLAIPMNHFYSDLYLIHHFRQTPDEFADAMLRAADCLAQEATLRAGACVLPLVLHPWITGATHRIGAIERMLEELAARPEVEFTNADQLARRSGF